MMDLKTVFLVQVVTLASLLPGTLSYCTWAGANPYWTGTPTVEQVSVSLMGPSLPPPGPT